MPTHQLRFLPFLSALLWIVLLDGAWAQSQATTGVIRGFVWDQFGNPIADATVALVETRTNYERTLTSSDLGLFTATLLPLGSYDVTVQAAGQAEVRQTGSASASRRDRGIDRQNAAADGGNDRRGGLAHGGYNAERTGYAPARRGRAGPAQQRAQLPQPDAVDARGGHRPRSRRRRAEHWRAARHSQQHLSGWR